MKRFKKVLIISLPTVFLATSVLFFLLQPVFALGNSPLYSGDNNFEWKKPEPDTSRKTVLIIADNKLTEMFDMLAPFYMFNATGKVNVYIVAKQKAPILIKKDLFVLPQLTFEEVDSLNLVADVIVIPALSIRDEKQDPAVISFIKQHFTPETRILAVCDGAATAAATGLFDGKPITCHASDFETLSSHFSKPMWIQQVNVAHSGNLYSTAGVSNAVEGSLMVINDLFGPAVMQSVANDIHYPHSGILTSHQSIAITTGIKFRIASKVILRKNRRLGVLLQDGIKEFDMVSVLDTYARSFPRFIKSMMLSDSTVQTKYGLTLVRTGSNQSQELDEIHIFQPVDDRTIASIAGDATRVRYDQKSAYPIDVCISRIGQQYGNKFQKIVRLLLDYN
jgi:putative intracellular protease/amidase